jgi:GTP pyrophosphokinase/guanosine-3',5'-bis(diphosphate) 3'-pyrophosphohydrolase
VDVDVRDAEHLHAVRMAVDSDEDVAEVRRHRHAAPRRTPVPA